MALAVFWLQTALSAEKSGAARADSTRPSGADCGVFSLTGLSLPLPFPFLPLCHIFGELSKDADLSGKCQLLGGICPLREAHTRHSRHWYGDEYGMSSYDQILLKVEAIAAPRRRLVTHKLVSNRLYVNY